MVAAVVVLAVGMGGTAQSQSARWPDARVSLLWPSFSAIPRPARAAAGVRSWDGSFRRCVESARVPFDYRCEYSDSAGNVGYACVSAGDSSYDLSQRSVNAVVAPADPTYASASPAQVCFASLAFAMSLG